MNILFVQNDLNPTSGGIARVSNLLYKYLINHGHEVYFLYYLSDNDEIDDSHKFKYQLTMDGKFLYEQVGNFVKQISGGKLHNYTRIVFPFHATNLCKIA